MLGCIIQYVLLAVVNYEKHYYAWLVTPVAIIIHLLFVIKDKRKRRVKTFVGEANGYLWMAIGISFFGLSIYMSHIGWQHSYPIYIMMYGIGTFVSGGLLQFKPLQIGGALCLPLMIVCVYVDFDIRILITAFAVLISYIIPGYMLRSLYSNKKNS
ncbi:MAG: hypothetical protein JWQ96_2678 [Segetibacter sp.]|nr:hypothetical protein [Segetibacter sp.]